MALEESASFLLGGGDMGARIRAFDWAAHPLGDPAGWPQALRTVIRLMLTSQHPTLILWGREFFCLYNDAFAQSLGPEKHPAMLGAPGRVMWKEVWPVVGAELEQVLAGQGAFYREDQLVPIERNGALEQVYWTYSYSPIDHAGGIGGVLVLCTETTARVLGETRREQERARQLRLFEQAPGFIIVMRGPDHVVEFVNEAHNRVFGSDDWTGRPIRNAFPSITGQGFFELLDQVYATGETYEAKGVQVTFRRAPADREETRHLTFIYAPLFDDDGRVSGIFCEGFDVTDGHVAELRREIIAELADRLRDVETPEAIAYTSAEVLGRALGVSRAGYGTIDTAAETITIERDWNAPGSASLAGTLHFRDYGSYIDDLKAGRTVIVDDVGRDPRTAAMADSLAAIGARAFVNMPVTERGGFVALLYLNHFEPRPWSEAELALVREIAERTRTAVARREAEEALRENEARLRFLDALGRDTATVTDADAVMAITTRKLGEHLAVADCAYADMEADEDMFNIRGDWHAEGAASIVGRYSLSTFGSLAVRNLKAGVPLIVNDNVPELGADGAKAFLDIGIRATICMPYLKEGRLVALMAIHDSKPHQWSEAELGLLREVTERSWAHIERVRTEAALRDSESRLRLALEGAQIGTWEWDLVAMRGTWSPRTCEIMGFETGSEITPQQRRDGIHPGDRDWVMAAVRCSIERCEPFSAEYRIVRPDGAVRWIASRGLVEADAAGRPVRTIGTVRDVTQRRHAQEELAAFNATLERQIAERTAERDRMWRLSGDLFMVVGPNWDIRAVNPAATALLGYQPEDVVGRRFRRFIHPGDVRAVAHAIRMAAAAPLRDFMARIRTRDGGWRRFAWSAVPGDGEAYVIGRDITDEMERRTALDQAQEALRQAQKMEALGQVTGGVAHDFNNLLTPIIGSIDLLRRNAEPGTRERRLLDGAIESAERARILVQRLLAFARRQPLLPGPVDLGDLLDGMAGLIASTSGPRIEVVVDIAPGLSPALADRNQLEMAILNLSVNARDAMPNGGTLSLVGRFETVAEGSPFKVAAGDYVRLSVSDTGTGMSEEILARAIDPFFSTKGIGKGTGLGLSMVHGLASQLGGTLLLSSRVGLGTTVDLLLPVASESWHAGDAQGQDAVAQASGHVLLVDDEAPVRAASRELLLDLGYSVAEASGAEEALAYLDANPVDYVVTDHLMPGMSGTDLARTVRERFQGTRILIVSGYADLDEISADLPRLAKPFRQDELAAALASLPADGH